MATTNEARRHARSFDARRGRCSDSRRCGAPCDRARFQATSFTRDEIADQAQMSEHEASGRNHSKMTNEQGPQEVFRTEVVIHCENSLYLDTKKPLDRGAFCAAWDGAYCSAFGSPPMPLPCSSSCFCSSSRFFSRISCRLAAFSVSSCSAPSSSMTAISAASPLRA